MRLLRLAFLMTLISSVSARAAERPLESLIDQRIDAKLAADKITPAGTADDATLIRRLTLDLVGRIPTVGESEAYLKSSEADKRAKLVDRLMASPAFDRYQAILFDAMLNSEPGRGRSGSVRDYLVQAMKDKKPWDVIFRELMLPGADEKTKSAGEFLRARVQDAD
ncbi:MAG: DUF1549 domain-containing protein, partial [Planctomycetia bacterium]|nr:DUF1549 domain-containing protein [Planctomycetia bacterium]